MIKEAEKTYLDVSLLIVPVLLILIGFVCLYSTSKTFDLPVLKTPFGKQLVWLLLGIPAFLLFYLVPIRFLNRGAYVFYGISVFFLVLVLFMGTGSVDRWIRLGFFNFQPSEVAKITTILALGKFLSSWKESELSVKQILVILFFIGIPFALIMKEPDVGTAVVFLGIFIGVAVWGGINIKTVGLLFAVIVAMISGFAWWVLLAFLMLLVIVMILMKQNWRLVTGIGTGCFLLGLLGPRIWAYLEPYQQKRILIFLGMKSDPHGSAYQVIQSKVAIGSGGFLGKGFLRGSQTQLRFLPEQHNDFIFSVLGEEFGFVGVIVVLALFFYLLHRLLKIAGTARNRFAGYVVVGCVFLLAFQIIVNIGMTVGLVPVTGLPLPFLSYGGSSLLMSMGMMGLLANVSANRYRY